ESPVFALQRVSADRKDSVLVLVNTDVEKPQTLAVSLNDGTTGCPRPVAEEGAVRTPRPALSSHEDLLGQPAPEAKLTGDGKIQFALKPGACYCLALTGSSRRREEAELHSPQVHPPPHVGGYVSGEAYRRARAQAALAVNALSQVLEPERIGPHDWRALAELADRDPNQLLGSLAYVDNKLAGEDLLAALNAAGQQKKFPQVATWCLIDRRRVMLVPPGHWLLVRDRVPFRVTLRLEVGGSAR